MAAWRWIGELCQWLSGVEVGASFNGCLASNWGPFPRLSGVGLGASFNGCLASDWGRLDLGPVVVATMVVDAPVAFSLVSPVVVVAQYLLVEAPVGYVEGISQCVASVYVVSTLDD